MLFARPIRTSPVILPYDSPYYHPSHMEHPSSITVFVCSMCISPLIKMIDALRWFSIDEVLASVAHEINLPKDKDNP